MKVLDHGYVKPVAVCGSDEEIIEAARMSTSGGFVSWEPYEGHPKGDAGLLSYLWKNQHTTPFEFGDMTLEIQAPIFVVREWHRHRTFSYNEASARYAPLPDLNYVPTAERVMRSGGANKQAAGDRPVSNVDAAEFCCSLQEFYKQAEELYTDALSAGVPRELARACLPVGRYTRMRAKANLLNWIKFIRLREADNAQWEIQEYARACKYYLADAFPRTLALYEESRG